MQTTRVVDPTDVLWRRIGAFLVDVVITAILWGVLALVLRGVIGSVITWVVVLVIVVANAVVLQGLTGASVGKKMIGIAVVDDEGRVCGIGKATVRWLLWIVDAFPWCFPAVGLITCFSSKDSQRVGDRVAGTYVVDKSFVGSPPFALAFPADPDQPPYRLNTMSAYQTGPVNAPTTPAPGTAHEPPPAAPEGYEASPAKPGNEPVWDPERNTYVRWDARYNRWLAFDEQTRQWTPTT